jgi:hypothetical protein
MASEIYGECLGITIGGVCAVFSAITKIRERQCEIDNLHNANLRLNNVKYVDKMPCTIDRVHGKAQVRSIEINKVQCKVVTHMV